MFRAFGNDADSKLHVLEQEDNTIHAFKYFKMNLFNSERTVEAQNGTQVPVLDVITYSLKVFIHLHFMFDLINMFYFSILQTRRSIN